MTDEERITQLKEMIDKAINVSSDPYAEDYELFTALNNLSAEFGIFKYNEKCPDLKNHKNCWPEKEGEHCRVCGKKSTKKEKETIETINRESIGWFLAEKTMNKMFKAAKKPVKKRKPRKKKAK